MHERAGILKARRRGRTDGERAKVFGSSKVDAATVKRPQRSDPSTLVREAGPVWTPRLKQPEVTFRRVVVYHLCDDETLVRSKREREDGRTPTHRRHLSPSSVHPHKLRHPRRGEPIDDQHTTRRNGKPRVSACVRSGQPITDRLRHALEHQALGIEQLRDQTAGRVRGGQQPPGGVRGRSAALDEPGSYRIANRRRPDDAPRLSDGQCQKEQVPSIRKKPRPDVGGFLRLLVERRHRRRRAARVGDLEQSTRPLREDDHAARKRTSVSV